MIPPHSQARPPRSTASTTAKPVVARPGSIPIARLTLGSANLPARYSIVGLSWMPRHLLLDPTPERVWAIKMISYGRDTTVCWLLCWVFPSNSHEGIERKTFWLRQMEAHLRYAALNATMTDSEMSKLAYTFWTSSESSRDSISRSIRSASRPSSDTVLWGYMVTSA